MTLGQLSIRQGSIAQVNSEATDFKAKADIRSALTLVDKSNADLDDLELGHGCVGVSAGPLKPASLPWTTLRQLLLLMLVSSMPA